MLDPEVLLLLIRDDRMPEPEVLLMLLSND